MKTANIGIDLAAVILPNLIFVREKLICISFPTDIEVSKRSEAQTKPKPLVTRMPKLLDTPRKSDINFLFIFHTDFFENNFH